MNVKTSCDRHRHVVALVNAGPRLSLLRHVHHYWGTLSRLALHVTFIPGKSSCCDHHGTSRSCAQHCTSRSCAHHCTSRSCAHHCTSRSCAHHCTSRSFAHHARPVVVLNTARPVVVSRHVAINTLLRSSRCGPSMERSSLQASGADCVWWLI